MYRTTFSLTPDPGNPVHDVAWSFYVAGLHVEDNAVGMECGGAFTILSTR